MIKLCFIIVSVLACLTASTSATSTNVTVVAHNLTWIENLWCDSDTKSLWASESLGHIWRISQASDGSWQRHLHVSAGIIKSAGLTIGQDRFFALVNTDSKTGAVIEVDRTKPESFSVIATLPNPVLGDGLAYFNNSLYISHEGDFVPGKGVVWRVDLSANNTLSTILNHKFATDGAFVDQGILYVSEVVGTKVMAVDLNGNPDGKFLGIWDAPKGVHLLDDFAVSSSTSASGESIVTLTGASYGTKAVVSFEVNSHQQESTFTTLVDHIAAPASVRQGCAGVGGEDVFFASEGGGMISGEQETTRRVLMVDAPSPYR